MNVGMNECMQKDFNFQGNLKNFELHIVVIQLQEVKQIEPNNGKQFFYSINEE